MITQGSIPRTPIKQKPEPFDIVVGHLVAYMELARATRALLGNAKKLTPPMDLRLSTEINFCGGTLVNVCRIATEVLATMTEKVRKDPGFEEEVKSMSDFICPDRGRILITTDEFKARPPLPTKHLRG